MKTYLITYDHKIGGRQFNYDKIIIADTAKEAREKFDEWHAKEFQATPLRNPPHAFHVDVRVFDPGTKREG